MPVRLVEVHPVPLKQQVHLTPEQLISRIPKVKVDICSGAEEHYAPILIVGSKHFT